MKPARVLPLAVLLFAVLALSPPLVSAEWMADLYLGVATTSDGDTTRTVDGFVATAENQYESSVVIGGRIGYWFEGLPWLGLALDVSWFAPNEEGPFLLPNEIDVVPVSALVMARWSLNPSSEFPKGQFQPYVGAGPGVFFSSAEEEVTGLSDTSVDIGLDIRAGLTWLFTRNLGFFGEYRYTFVEPEWEDTIAGLTLTAKDELSTHHFAVGVTYRF